jgi:glycerol uptake facilitator-like aquaporin
VNLARRATAEAVGTVLLLAAVVGSGIMAQRLADGNVAIALLANTIATGGALAAIILAFGPISGAHLNPAVTIVDAWQRGIGWRDVPAYIGAQIVGALHPPSLCCSCGPKSAADTTSVRLSVSHWVL